MRLMGTVSHGETLPPEMLVHGRVLQHHWKEVRVAPEVVAGSRATPARLYQEQWGVGLREKPGTDSVQAK